MTPSPFPSSKHHAGEGEIHLKLLPPNTPTFQTLSFTYPLKLVHSTPHRLSPKDQSVPNDSKDPLPATNTTAPSNVPLVFMLSYGGGLLPPDSINLSITLDPSTRLTLTTQGSTKIFPSTSSTIIPPSPTPSVPPVAIQTLTASIHDNAALLLAPDPIQPFARSHYCQTQIFILAPTASLCLLDWVVEGRRARDERWQAGSWRGRNEIWREFEAEAGLRMEMEKVLMLRDVVVLEGGPAGPGQSSLRHEDMGVFGTIILAGPVFESLGKLFMDEFVALPRIGGRKWGDEDDCVKDEDDATREFRSWRTRRVEQEVRDNLLWSAANLRSSVVVKFTARELEGAKSWIESMWRWDRTIADEFGPGGFMCLR